MAICDINEENMKDKILKLELSESIHMYTDYKQMLEREKPELVSIATESGKHAQIALECINAGCNIIIEKPIALSIEDADKIIDLSEKMGVKVCACHQNRFNKSIQKIRDAVEKNRFGKLLYGTAHIRWARDYD